MNPLIMILILTIVAANLQGCAAYAWGLREASSAEWQKRDRQTRKDATMRDVRRILKEHRK